MEKFEGHFKCVILSPNRLIYESTINSLFLTGDKGEYELLPYHYSLLGVLREGDVIINWKERVPIKKGVVRFFANECTIMIEEKIIYEDHLEH